MAEIEDPDLRRRVAANVTLATRQEKQAYLANQRQLKSQAKDILDRGGGITSIPYQTYSGIDPQGREAIDGYAKAGGRSPPIPSPSSACATRRWIIPKASSTPISTITSIWSMARTSPSSRRCN